MIAKEGRRTCNKDMMIYAPLSLANWLLLNSFASISKSLSKRQAVLQHHLTIGVHVKSTPNFATVSRNANFTFVSAIRPYNSRIFLLCYISPWERQQIEAVAGIWRGQRVKGDLRWLVSSKASLMLFLTYLTPRDGGSPPSTQMPSSMLAFSIISSSHWLHGKICRLVLCSRVFLSARKVKRAASLRLSIQA